MTTAETTNEGIVIHARDVRHDYGLVSVLEGISLDLHRGEITAVIGPNGSGKTTLLRAIASIHEPTDGTVQYIGPQTARPIGYLPQHPEFRPGQTVESTMQFYAGLVGGTNKSAKTALARVGMADAADRKVEALSGGMTRLLAIAQATIGNPPAIILDEPASGLDPEMRIHVFTTLTDIAADETAVLLSSHDLALVEETADRLLVLDNGKPVATGRVEEIYQETKTDSLLEAFKHVIDTDPGKVRVQGVTDD